MNHGIEAEFQIIKEIDALSKGPRGYRQLTLPTEFVISSPAEVRPEFFAMMRYAWSEMYWLPSRSVLLPYHEFVAALKAAGTPFNGTSHHRCAMDVEFWECEGDDGHVEYRHQANYRIVFERNDPWAFLAGVTGSQFSYSLGEKVREFSKGSG